MKKALVLGATGSMGSALVLELLNRGIEVKAFARNKNKLKELFYKESVTLVSGDVFNPEELMHAAHDVDVIFHAINLPYQDWEEKQHILLRNILGAAEKTGTKLAIVDNIYSYGRSKGIQVKEDSFKNPHTKKGAIRLSLQQMAQEANVPLFIVQFPDFYGPNAENTLLHFTFQSMVKNKKARFVGDQSIAREYIYTPDGAKAMVELAIQNRFNGETWNIPGAGTITGTEIIQIAKDYIGSKKKVSTVTKNMIRLLGLFDPSMKEYREMYYLNEDPVVLSGEKYESQIGKIPATSYKAGIEASLKSLSEK